ncbi:MAG: tyrosinase family protein, partial [Allosphingosinicella sp.]
MGGLPITRRTVLAGAGALVLAPRVAFAEAGPKRLPLAEFAKDERLVEALRRGVRVMRERPGSDPGSWFWQGAVHAYSDEIHADALRADAKVSKVDSGRFWKQCPHFGQASANFLIFHRAYLYYFERVLRAAAKEPDLALPYWNYDEEGQRGFPELFAPAFLDPAKKQPNPLYHKNRELAFVRGLYTLSEPVCAAKTAREAAQFFSEPGVTGFGGDLLAEGTRPGLIEQRPHNDLHVAVGGVVGGSNGAMADIPTAAFDPIFWVHHANIDRLWRQWESSPGRQWGPLPPDEWFDETPWTFIDSDGSEQSKPRRFWLEPANLGIAYADAATNGRLPLPAPGTALAAAEPEPPVATRALARSGTVAVRPGAPAAA